MFNFDATIYRECEAHWRREAARFRTSSDRTACETLAEGYAELVAIGERSNLSVALLQYLVAAHQGNGA